MTIASSDPEAQKIENLRAFFDGEAPECTQSGLSVGLNDEDYKKRNAAKGEAILAEFDQLMADDDEPQPPAPAPTVATEAAEPTCERIDDAPALTPYDKARQRLTDAEILRDVAAPGSDEYHEAMANEADAKRAFKVEQERATDDGWRKRRATDEWRAGEGREEYNASRRKVRDKPNAMTPKDVLDAMTPEERAQHDADKNAEKQWRYGRRKAGWSAEKIEAALPGWWARRLANRT